MNITEAKYVVDELSNKKQSVTVVINGRTWSVPISEGNRHYQAILEMGGRWSTISPSGDESWVDISTRII
jgi:hypothetical protein